jgi:hypothetical protein
VRRAGALLITVLLTAACGGDEGSAEALCTAVREQPSVATAFSGFDPTDPEQALEQLRSARVTLGELHQAAPSEVAHDLQVEIDYIQALIDGLDGVADSAEAAAVVQQVTEEHPGVSDAAAALTTFTEESCGTTPAG